MLFADHLLNIVLQKEYLIIHPDNQRPVLATDSVRSCYAIILYHPTKSGILHFDDNICHLDFDLFLDEFLSEGEAVEPSMCKAHLVGGWPKHRESSKTGHFLRDKCIEKGLEIDLTYFQVKTEGADPEKATEQGFSWVAMNAATGEVRVSDDWSTYSWEIKENDGRYWGEVSTLDRESNRRSMDLVLMQTDEDPASGTHIYHRDRFDLLRERQSTAMCKAASDNVREQIIRTLETGVTSLNTSPKNAKGWTALHFACKLGHLKMAKLLIYLGASLDKQNDRNNTPWRLVQDKLSDDAQALRLAYDLLQENTKASPIALLSYSFFARGKGESIEAEELRTLNRIDKHLQTEYTRAKLRAAAGL